MSRLLLARYGTLQALSRLEWQSFCSVPGIGEAKAKHLAAAFELGKRLARQSSPHIPLSTPAEVAANEGAGAPEFGVFQQVTHVRLL